MPTINICGNDYKVPKPVASYLSEACDALWKERNELAMIQDGVVFEDRVDPMAVFSQEYNRMKQQAFAWRMLCERTNLPLGIHPDEVARELVRQAGPSRLTPVPTDRLPSDAGEVAPAPVAPTVEWSNDAPVGQMTIMPYEEFVARYCEAM